MVSDKGKELIRKLIEKLRGGSPRSVKQAGSRVVQAAPVRSKAAKKPAKKKAAVKSKPKPVKKIVKKAKPVKKAVKKIAKKKKR